MRLTSILIVSLLTLAAPLAPMAAGAQTAAGNPFAPVARVNETAITRYELSQREKLMTVLSGPGDHREQALKALIDDRLRLDRAAKLGITVSDANLKAAEEEFAKRTKLSLAQLQQTLTRDGVAPQTFRDFIRAGLAWRDVVGATIAPQVTIDKAEVRDAQALSLAHGLPEVLISELILPATPQYVAQTKPLAEQLSRTLHGDAAFSAAARKYSVSQSASRGGKLDWMPASNLPPSVVNAVLALSPGEVSPPIAIPNALVLFEMRGLRDAKGPAPDQIKVDYLSVTLPGTPAQASAEAARIGARATACDDVYPLVRKLPRDAVRRVDARLPKVPADVVLGLARIDPGEYALLPGAGGTSRFVMLCSRRIEDNPPKPLDALRGELFNSKVNAMADLALARLRAQAIIQRYP